MSIDKIVQELLTQKFKYFGNKLSDRIQSIRKSDSFQNLIADDIEEYLKRVALLNNKEANNTNVRITVYIEKDKSNGEGFKKALLASAYFPEELDPQTKTSPLVSLSKFKFIHKQLADALCYNHPLARKYLNQIISVCNVPLDNAEFCNNYYCVTTVNLENCISYSVPVIVSYSEENNDESEGINEAIKFRSYSKKLLKYFQELLDPNQHPEMRKYQGRSLVTA